MRVLDLFCGEGGAGYGYHQAGFEVVGVDLHAQPRYPFAFVRSDCLALDVRFLRFFDLIHASPPCQFGTAMRHAPNAKGEAGHPNLIPGTRKLLQAAGVPYVIENVVEVAPYLIDPVMLCGSMFGLGCTLSTGERFHLQRRRVFETSWGMTPPRPATTRAPVIGVYGGHVRNRSAMHGGRGTIDFPGENRPALAAEAMGMPWATMKGMSEAIPPAFTRYIGAQFAARHSQREAA